MPIAKAHTLQHVSGALGTPRVRYITARSAMSPLTTTANRHISWKMSSMAMKINGTILTLTLPCQFNLVVFLLALQECRKIQMRLSHGV